MDIEVDHEFWTSLKLISARPEEENTFGTTLHSYSRGKTELKDDTNVVAKCKVAEARSLPITTIISRIQAEDSGSDSDYETADGGHHPPPSHTGGKWKPANISFDDSNISPRKSPSLDVLPSSHLTNSQSNGTGASDQFCDVCSLRFTKVENLVIHLTSKKHRSNITLENKHLAAQLYTRHHSDLLKRAAFQCCCCTFAAVEHTELITHLKSQLHKQTISKLSGPMECVSCGFLDYTGTNMLIHCMSREHAAKISNKSVVIKEKKSQIKCFECPKVLHSTVQYARHVKYQHSRVVDPNAKVKSCNFCSFQGKPSAVHQHITRSHSKERSYLCKVCRTGYHSKYDLVKHYSTKKHLESLLDSYRGVLVVKNGDSCVQDPGVVLKNTKACKFCAFITPELKLLQDHYTKEHSNEQADESLAPIPSHKRPVFCRYCYKQFADKSQSFTHEVSHIQKHLQSTSEDIISTCFICYAEGNTSLIEHLSLHNPYAKDKKSSVEEENQTSKMTTNSKRDKSRYPCTVEGCLRSYKTKGDLKIHLASHSGNKKFPCPQCEKRFPTKKQLSAHSLTHSSHTPYSCDYCNYKCKTRCHLQRHMRIHAGSKPYSCPYCQYSSTTIGNLRKHVIGSKKHKGLPMYECSTVDCNFVTDTLNSLSQHLSRVHNIHDKKLMTKSTENDWTEIIEGHPIIQAQH